jgi:hypothetical protein
LILPLKKPDIVFFQRLERRGSAHVPPLRIQKSFHKNATKHKNKRPPGPLDYLTTSWTPSKEFKNVHTTAYIVLLIHTAYGDRKPILKQHGIVI